MNPFELEPKKLKNNYYSLQQLALKSYDKYEVDPYTKTRIILMNGTEFESVWFYHQFSTNKYLHLTREVARQCRYIRHCLYFVAETEGENLFETAGTGSE